MIKYYCSIVINISLFEKLIDKFHVKMTFGVVRIQSKKQSIKYYRIVSNVCQILQIKLTANYIL